MEDQVKDNLAVTPGAPCESSNAVVVGAGSVAETDRSAGSVDGNCETKTEQQSDSAADPESSEVTGDAQAKSWFTERSDFTSEVFKIEITNLPRKFGFSQLKKRLTTSLGLRPHKLKAVPNKPFAFVCFSCEEDRETALKQINGHVWKGKELHAKKAQPTADPLKRKLESRDKASEGEKRQKLEEMSSLPPAVRLKASVTPLWETPYSEQLQMKTDTVREVLRDVAKHHDVRQNFFQARKLYEGLCCPLLPATPSPVMEDYRNKSEFSIGRSEDGKETVVGFRFGLYKDGTDCVGSPSEISIISPASKAVVQSFQNYVQSVKYEPFDHRTHTGHWRQLTVRTTQGDGGIMAIVEFVVQDTTVEEREKVKASIREYFTEGEGKSAGVTSFFFRPCTRRSTNSTSEEPYELIFGEKWVYETLMGMKFRISPSAFFQVNTAGAEVLYKLIADWSGASPATTVLDICCGTGTIGLSMAKNVAKVIGIEMCKEAVEDAKVNAEINEIKNCSYICAKVQDVIQDVVSSLYTNDVVAILDPPRAGIHNSVIKALRSCRQLKRIVYAACHPQIAKTNFIDLVRPSSRKNKGEPFQFVKAMPVDMFPHTRHCELLVLFERGSPPSASDRSSLQSADKPSVNAAERAVKSEDGTSVLEDKGENSTSQESMTLTRDAVKVECKEENVEDGFTTTDQDKLSEQSSVRTAPSGGQVKVEKQEKMEESCPDG